MKELERERAHLRTVCESLFSEIPPLVYAELQKASVTVSVSTSRCSYTQFKRNIYMRVTDDSGALYTACALREVLIHELAHVLYAGLGHNTAYWEEYRQMREWFESHGVGICQPPPQFNPCSQKK